MKNIIEFIKCEMEDKGITYEQLAVKIGTTRQNLWMKLNKSIEPNFETVKKILEGLGYAIEIKCKEIEGESREEYSKNFLECIEEEQVSYECAEKILNSLGYELKLRTQKNESGVKNGIDN